MIKWLVEKVFGEQFYYCPVFIFRKSGESEFFGVLIFDGKKNWMSGESWFADSEANRAIAGRIRFRIAEILDHLDDFLYDVEFLGDDLYASCLAKIPLPQTGNLSWDSDRLRERLGCRSEQIQFFDVIQEEPNEQIQGVSSGLLAADA